MKEKFMLIHAEKAVFPLVLMVRLLKVSRAGYYAWVKRRNSPLCPRSGPAVIASLRVIRDLHEASKQTSGYRRIRAGLARMGERVSEGLVRSIMGQLDLAGIQPRTSKRTTIPAADVAERPDCLRRDRAMRNGLISKHPRSEGLYRPTDGGRSTLLSLRACELTLALADKRLRIRTIGSQSIQRITQVLQTIQQVLKGEVKSREHGTCF